MSENSLGIEIEKEAYLQGIDRHGWTQGNFENNKGEMCTHGIIRQCTPQKGDGYIISRVLRNRGIDFDWNDATDRSLKDVVEMFKSVESISDEEIEQAYGPQYREVVALIRKAARLTAGQRSELRAADAAADAYAAAFAAAFTAAYAYADADADAAESAAADADAASDAAADTAKCAAACLSARHLIGEFGFTQKDYDDGTRPWVSVMGPVHPGYVSVEDVVNDVLE